MIGALVVCFAWAFVGCLCGMAAVAIFLAWKRPQMRPRDWKQPESFEDPPEWLKWTRINGDHR
jgi:hypothetical protein